MKSVLVWLATAVLVIALPLVFAGGAVRFLFSYQPLYEYDFNTYHIADYTGIDRTDLSRVANAFIAYFNNDEAEMNLTVTQHGIKKDLFTEREVLHMVDVKNLVRLFYRLQVLGIAYGIAFAAVAIGFERVRAAARLGTALMLGGALTVAIVVTIGALSFVNFDQLFLTFHELSFTQNDYWLLDPRIHNLIAMFPDPFWFDATMALAALILIQAVVVFIIGWQLRRIGRLAILPADLSAIRTSSN